MFEIEGWDECNVKGFDFDFEDIHDSNDLSSYPNDEAINILINEINDLEPDMQVCIFCHNMVSDSVMYEKDVLFCSKNCWISALNASLDDFVVGAMSSWPLELFTSYSARSLLLNFATQSCDSNLISKLLHHFRSTLTETTFKRLITENPIALNHFINFLRKTGQIDCLKEYYRFAGESELAEIQTFNQLTEGILKIDASSCADVINHLQQFAITDLSKHSRLKILQEVCLELVDVLKTQSLYNEEWENLYATMIGLDSTGHLFRSTYPSTLFAQPLNETIAAFVHMAKSVGVSSLPYQIRTHKKMSDEQFKWVVIEPLVSTENWKELENLLLEKKWLTRRTKTLIPSDRLVLYLSALGSSNQIIANYLDYVDDMNELLDLALRLKIYDGAIKACVKNRDQETMRSLLTQIPANHPRKADIVHYLSLPVNQWKTNTID